MMVKVTVKESENFPCNSHLYTYTPLLLTVESLSFTNNFTKEVSPLPCRQTERFGVVQAGEKERL